MDPLATAMTTPLARACEAAAARQRAADALDAHIAQRAAYDARGGADWQWWCDTRAELEGRLRAESTCCAEALDALLATLPDDTDRCPGCGERDRCRPGCTADSDGWRHPDAP